MTESATDGLMAFNDALGRGERLEAIFAEHFGDGLAAAGTTFAALIDDLGEGQAIAMWGCVAEDYGSRDDSDGNIIDLFLARQVGRKGASDKAYLAALRSSAPGLYQIAGRSLGRPMLMLRDLVRGGDAIMVDIDATTHGLTPGLVLVGRVVTVAGSSTLSTGRLGVPPGGETAILEALRTAFGKTRKGPWKDISDEQMRGVAPLLSQVWLERALAALRAEGLSAWEVLFPLARGVKQKDVAARLKSVPTLFKIRSDWLWSRSGNKPAFEESDGLIGFDGRTLFLETAGEAWAREGAAMLAEALGDLVGAPVIRDEAEIDFEDENAPVRASLSSGAQAKLDQAQDLVYQAWDARSQDEAVKLARQALDISSFCADAYVILAEAEPDLEERVTWYRLGVAGGEAAIGREAFEALAGDFWLAMETRPYMRARGGLAVTLLELGEVDEAIGHLQQLLRLCPNDNPGNRDILCDVLLARGDDKGLKALFKAYPDDHTVRLYSRALVAFRGKAKDAAKLAGAAFGYNRHVPGMLTGPAVAEPEGPYITVGGEDEAAEYAVRNRAAWEATPGAVAWLGEAVGVVAANEA